MVYRNRYQRYHEVKLDQTPKSDLFRKIQIPRATVTFTIRIRHRAEWMERYSLQKRSSVLNFSHTDLMTVRSTVRHNQRHVKYFDICRALVKC